MYGNVYYAIQEADQIIKSTIAEVTVDNETSNQESQQDDPQRTREPLCNICEAANLQILHSYVQTSEDSQSLSSLVKKRRMSFKSMKVRKRKKSIFNKAQSPI